MVNEKPPTGLQARGRAKWRDIVERWDLRPDELGILHSACAATDRLEALTKNWKDDGRPVTTTGSQGQLVIHPLLSEIRQLEAHIAGLTARLKLPDETGGSGAGETNQQRDAADSRWAQHKKSGA